MTAKRGQALADKAYTRKDYIWSTLGPYKTRKSAQAIASMIRRATGLHAFEKYPAGTFETRLTEANAVEFRRYREWK